LIHFKENAMIEENEGREPATPLFLKVVVAFSVAMTVANVALMKMVAMGL
jgi:hypothetical protein